MQDRLVTPQPKISQPSPGAVGGAANEAGSSFRAGVAAWVAAHILRGQPFARFHLLPEHAIPLSMTIEGDEAVDDVSVRLSSGKALMQAKSRLDFRDSPQSSMRSVVNQWKKQLDLGLDRDQDRLVAVAASASQPILDLRSALARRRRQVAGEFSRDERNALDKLTGWLGDVSEASRDLILDCATIWIADLEDSDGLEAQLGQALLEPGVVEIDLGSRAWRALREEARELGRQRYGATLDDLIHVLKAVPLELTADGEGYASARAEQRRIVVDAYRERVKFRGEMLDLRGLGAKLPPLPLEQIDARVAITADSPEHEHDDTNQEMHVRLPWALRRRGRALLVGLPGSGKSVALRAAAAHYAARPAWPMPIVVALDRVARLMNTTGFDDALLEAAFQEEPTESRGDLRAAAIEALRTGDAALFLDALDEVRSLRSRVLQGIDDKLKQLNPAVELLLTTRDVAYADAHTLGLPDLRVVSPDRPDETVTAILRAVAQLRQLPAEEGRAWVDKRKQWVTEHLETDRRLRETPLMVILLTLLAVEHDASALPVGRANVLKRVVDDVVDRWESGQRLKGDPPRIGSLEGIDAVLAARQAFRNVGHLVFTHTDPILDEVIADLAGCLSEPFGLASGLAQGAAKEALGLWDQAGVFIIPGQDRRVRARMRAFAELAEAEHVRALPEDRQRDWVRTTWSDPDCKQAVLLAAGLSQSVCDELILITAGDINNESAHKLVRQALQQHAPVGDEALATLVDTLLTEECDDGTCRWERARTLLELPVAPTDQPRGLEFIDALKDPAGIVARALTTETWSRTDNEVQVDLMALVELDPPGRRRLSGSGLSRFRGLRPDPHYERAVVIATRELLTRDRPDVAQILIQRLRSGVSVGTGNVIRQHLVDCGFGEMVAELDRLRARPDLSAVAALFEGSKAADFRLLEIMVTLSPAAELTRIQRRRLDDLVSLVRTSGFQDAAANEAVAAVMDNGDYVREVLSITASLARLDPSVIAGEAQELRRELEREERHFTPWMVLSDAGQRLELSAWDRVPNAQAAADTLASGVASRYAWIGRLAVECLESAPMAIRERASGNLQSLLPKTDAGVQRLVAIAILILDSEDRLVERFSQDPRPMVRRAVAWSWGWRRHAEEQTDALKALLADCDAGVREEAVRSIATLGIADTVRGALLEASRKPPGWECVWCGAGNAPPDAACRQCRLDGP